MTVIYGQFRLGRNPDKSGIVDVVTVDVLMTEDEVAAECKARLVYELWLARVRDRDRHAMMRRKAFRLLHGGKH
jgi:hypothetical protein